MTASNTNRKNGISTRAIHLAMIFCALVIVVLLALTIFQTSTVFSNLSRGTEQYIVRQKAAHDLMEASDYLTEMAQRFTLDGDTVYLDHYFEEAFVSRRREAAIVAMSEGEADPTLVQRLQEAMEESMSLMYREYYAMKLVIEAMEIRDYPDTLKAIELSEADLFLPAEEKMNLAQSMVMGKEYYASKEIIRTQLKTDLELLDEQMSQTRQQAGSQMMSEMNAARGVTIVMMILLLALIVMVERLLMKPVIRAADHAGSRKELPVEGTREIRALSERYNAMLEQLHPETEEASDSAE